MVLAEEHHCRALKEACLDFLDSPDNLHDVTVTGGLDRLRNSCSSVLIDLIAKLATLKHN
jgi:speckle-type POZ protein